VVKPGEFIIAAVALDHGHIYGMVNGLLEAGATLKWVYDRDPAKTEAFARTYPQVKIAATEEEILADPQVHLIAGAAVTSKRCALGLRVMDSGKDYFTDKAQFTWFTTAKGYMWKRRFMQVSLSSMALSDVLFR
jgi:predicted dehydrogenase